MEGRGGLAGRKSLGGEESQGEGGTLLFGLYGDVLPDRVWFFGHAVLPGGTAIYGLYRYVPL